MVPCAFHFHVQIVEFDISICGDSVVFFFFRKLQNNNSGHFPLIPALAIVIVIHWVNIYLAVLCKSAALTTRHPSIHKSWH
jgi:hypothetical protein